MTLPEGLKWLQAGWWLVHVVGTLVVYWYGYRKGREDMRRELGAGPTRPAGAKV